MKKFLLLCLLLPLAWCNAAHAQRILIGKRAPELRIATWLADSKPASAPLTYIEFYHSSGQNYSAFEVDYVPFGVLTNARNRVLWLGNTLQLTPEDIDRNL